jgi:hypothetical protein
MAKRNIIVMIHGMTPSPDPGDHTRNYTDLREDLTRREDQLERAIDKYIGIEWGHEPAAPPPGGLTPDQKITRAENVIHQRISFDQVREDDSPDNHLLPGIAELFSKWVTRHLTTPIKETILILGVTDVFYYCSFDGERAVRRAVYTQLLQGLEEYRAEGLVRLHVIAESLGATVAFDFLFGLFAPDTEFPDGTPGFVREAQASPEAIEAYTFWRARAQAGSLILGSKSTTGAQIPLLTMRKQRLVDQLSTGELLDPTVIGVPRDGPPRWKIFYDVDDVLGFPTRRLFDAHGSIQEYQVDTDWRPDLAHLRYWKNGTVLEEIAQLIRENLGGS